MNDLYLKVLLAVLATIVTLVFLVIAYKLAIRGHNEAALMTALAGPLMGGGGLFALFGWLSK